MYQHKDRVNRAALCNGIYRQRFIQTYVEEGLGHTMETEGPIMKDPRVLLKIVETACDAVIACNRQLNIIDSEFGNGDYGTVLSSAASAIKTAIQENRISAVNPYTIFSTMATIVDEVRESKARTYSLLFSTVAKSFLTYDKTSEITPFMWLYPLVCAITAISKDENMTVGDRCILDALVPAQLKLSEKLKENVNPVDAFGEAVKAAETSAARTVHMPPIHMRDALHLNKTPKYPNAEAHAVGIWMRGAYEAMKLAFI